MPGPPLNRGGNDQKVAAPVKVWVTQGNHCGHRSI